MQHRPQHELVDGARCIVVTEYTGQWATEVPAQIRIMSQGILIDRRNQCWRHIATDETAQRCSTVFRNVHEDKHVTGVDLILWDFRTSDTVERNDVLPDSLEVHG